MVNQHLAFRNWNFSNRERREGLVSGFLFTMPALLLQQRQRGDNTGLLGLEQLSCCRTKPRPMSALRSPWQPSAKVALTRPWMSNAGPYHGAAARTMQRLPCQASVKLRRTRGEQKLCNLGNTVDGCVCCQRKQKMNKENAATNPIKRWVGNNIYIYI